MNGKNRVTWMLVIVLVLLVANVYFRLGDEGIDRRALFGDETDLAGSYSGKVKKTIDDLNRLPVLSFHIRTEHAPKGSNEDRNPFILGVDRELERQARERMAEAARARAVQPQVVQAAPPPEPPKPTFPGRVLGLMRNREDGVTLVSVVLDGEYYILRQGESLRNRFKLVAIAAHQVRFLSLAENEEISVNLE